MSIANRVWETSATTGNGNISLGGVPSSPLGYVTFATKFAVNQRFTYWIDNSAGKWETGIGYISGSTTLVREAVEDTSAGNTTKIVFSGALQVYVQTSEAVGLYPPAVSIASPGNETAGPMAISSHYDAYSTSYNNRVTQLYLNPFVNLRGGAKFTAFSLYVKSAQTGAIARMGVYLIDPATGLPTGAPYMESDNIDVSASGIVSSLFTNNVSGIDTPISLPSAFYLALAFDDTGTKVQSSNWTANGTTWQGINANSAQPNYYQSYTMGTPTAGAAAFPTIATMGARGEGVPFGGLLL